MFVFAWLFMAICTVTDLHAAAIATLRNVAGPVDIMRGGALPAVPAKNGAQVASGDLVRTKTGGFTEVVYADGTVLRISQRSRVDIGEHFSGKSPDSGGVRLARGKVQAIVDLKNVKSAGTGAKKFEIRTPNAIAGVRGTQFFVSHERRTTGILVQSGNVYTFNPRLPNQIVTLTPGTVSTITGRQAPTPSRPALRQEIQRMEQGMTPPPSGSSGAGGAPGGPGAGGNGGVAAGGDTGGGGAGAGGGTPAGGGAATGGDTAGAGGGTAAGGGTGGGASSGGPSGGSSVFSPGAALPALPAAGGLVATPGASNTQIVNRLATGGVVNVIQANTTSLPNTNSGGQGAPTTSLGTAGGAAQIVTPPVTPPAPQPTNVNVNVGINFKGLPAKK